jgi:hypothetical protein
VVLACPLDTIGEVSRLRKAKRLLAAADGLSSASQDPTWSRVLNHLTRTGDLKEQAAGDRHPLNALVESEGFRFSNHTMLSEATQNALHVRSHWVGNGAAFLLRRGSAIVPVGAVFPEQVSIFAVTARGSWGARSLAPPQAEGASVRYEAPPESEGGLAVIVASKRVFALSDVELLSNQYAGTVEAQELHRRITEWLEQSGGA